MLLPLALCEYTDLACAVLLAPQAGFLDKGFYASAFLPGK
jgi:hypothetical protein